MANGILSMRANATKKATSLLTAGMTATENDGNFGLVAQYSRHLAELSLQSGELDQALHFASNALQITQAHNLWEKGEVYMTTARVNLRMNKINEAEKLVEQAFDYFQNKKLTQKAVLAQEFQRQIRNV